MGTRESDYQKRCNRAAQDILNLYAQVCIELGCWSVPEKFAHKFSKNKIAALIETRMMEGSYIMADNTEELRG